MVARSWARDPVAFARLASEVPLGAVLFGGVQAAEVVMLDADGVLWLLADGPRRDLVPWCLRQGIYVYPSVRALNEGLRTGLCVGLCGQVATLVGVPFGGDQLVRSAVC